MSNSIFIGQAAEGPQQILLGRANRHGLVAGATGTGKTVTLQVLAEAFSAAGVPVFAADIKGDLSGIAAAGTPNEKLLARAHVGPMVMAGREARSWLRVDAEGVKTKRQLEGWVTRGVGYARSLPRK